MARIGLVHGLGGTAATMQRLADALVRDGHECVVTTLPGHGTALDDLSRTGWEDWLAAVPDAEVLVGQSLGGALVLAAATRRPRVRAVVAINAPAPDEDAVEGLEWRQSRGHELIDGPPLEEGEAGYGQLPIGTLLAMARGVLDTDLSAVRVPVLLVSSALDEVVDPASAAVIETRLAGPVTRLTLPSSGHTASLGPEVDLLAEAIGEFATHADGGAEMTRRVLTEYVDASGLLVQSAPEAIQGVLAALGDEPIADADAVVVAWDGKLPARLAGARIVDDDGRALPTDRPLPFGYHGLVRGDEVAGTVISAPRHAPPTRPGRWGVFLPLYALRTDRTTGPAATRGMATYGDLANLFDWLHAYGGDIVLTLPLLPLYLDPPADWSPYSPVTRRVWSELYVDYDAVGAPDLAAEPQPDGGLLDHPTIAARRTARLDAVSARLLDDPDFIAWRAANPLVETYARFRGAQAVLGRGFRTWQVGRDSALAAADPTVVRRHLVGSWLADRQLAAVADHAHSQGQVLALDVALGTHADGFDVWHEPGLFVDGVSVGAPPDPIFMGGQDWGFPPMHPETSRRTGHRYVRETLRHHLRHTNLLRIDHVMGLTRQWWVPSGRAPTEGCYVRYPLEELIAVVCLEAHLAGAVVAGENLGTVPPEVNAQLREHQLLGLHIALDAMPTWRSDHIEVAPAGTMAMVSTHDTAPLAGWWRGTDLRTAHRLGLLDDDELAVDLAVRDQIREDVVGHLVWTQRLDRHDATIDEVVAAVADEVAGQPAQVAVFNLEDLWSEERPQNVPGTFQDEPNWRRVAALTIDEIASDPHITATAARINARRRDSALRFPP